MLARSFFVSVAIAVTVSVVFAQAPCVFNPATNRYQVCLHVTAGGQCIHYGPPCGNTEQFRYNPRTDSNQECLHMTAAGECVHWGQPGGVTGQCMYNGQTNSYQRCLHVTAGGQCVHFGPPCN